MESPKTGEGSEPTKPKRRFLKFWILGMLVIAGAVAGLSFAKPAYRWVRARQAAALALEARAYLEAEDWKAASDALRKAYQTSSKEPEVIRALAKFYSYADLKKQRKLFDELRETGKHTGEDLREMIALELKFRDLSKAKELTGELLTRFSETKENLMVSAEVAIAASDYTGAETQLGKIVALDPEDSATRLDLASMLLMSSFEEKARAGWEQIYEIARGGDEAALKALRLIVRQRPFFPASISEMYDLIKKHPDATERDFVAALGWRYESTSSPSEKEALLEAAIEERKGRSHKENRDLYFFLNTILEQKRVLELLPKEVAYSTPPLLTVYVTALLQEDKLDEIRKIVESQEEGLESSSEVSFIKAQCAIYLDMGTAEVRRELQDSYELALLDKRTEMLAHVASLAESRGLREFANTVYEAMANIPETSLVAYQKLLELARKRKDLPAMRTIGREIREKIPDSPEIIKLAVYFDLLHGTNLEAGFETVSALSARIPTDEECTVILAFAHYRLGDIKSAWELLANCDVTGLSPSYRAVYTLIRGASGDDAAAFGLAEKLPRALLLDEEVELVRPWLLTL